MRIDDRKHFASCSHFATFRKRRLRMMSWWDPNSQLVLSKDFGIANFLDVPYEPKSFLCDNIIHDKKAVDFDEVATSC